MKVDNKKVSEASTNKHLYAAEWGPQLHIGEQAPVLSQCYKETGLEFVISTKMKSLKTIFSNIE